VAVCLTESCIAKGSSMKGAVIDLSAAKSDMRLDDVLFGEAPSRIVVSVKSADSAKLAEIAKKHSIACYKLGKVGGDKLVIKGAIDILVKKLSDAWRNAIPNRTK